MERTRWRKALTIAVLFHSFLFCSLGVMAPRLQSAEKEEMYIEIEMASLLDGAEPMQELKGSAVSAANSADERPAQSENGRAQPVVAVNAAAMSLVAAETGGEKRGGEGGAFGASGAQDGGKKTGGNNATGNGGGRSGGISAPGILSRSEPTYPESARNAGQEGTVVVKIRIAESGVPSSVSVSRSSGFSSLDNAAVAAVERWRFIPAKYLENGQALACYTTLPIVFHLK